MDLQIRILKWYKRHSKFLDTILAITCESVSGNSIITNLLAAIQNSIVDGSSDDNNNGKNCELKAVTQEQVREIIVFLDNIRPIVLDLMEDIEELKAFREAKTIEERINLLRNERYQKELDKIIFSISDPLSETVNTIKKVSSINIINSLYLKLDQLGYGDHVIVYKCLNIFNDLVVAIKAVSQEISTTKFTLLKNEYKKVAKLKHPNIIQYHDLAIDQATEQCYFVIDYLEMETLRSLMTRKEAVFTLEETCSILRGVAQALDYAHQKRVLHLDLRPETILIDPGLQSYLYDFGVPQDLKYLYAKKPLEGAVKNISQERSPYLLPEQLKEEAAGVNSDIWAFGMIVYEMLSGDNPFGENPLDCYHSLDNGNKIITIEHLPKEVTRIIQQSLTVTRDKSLAGATKMVDLLLSTKGLGDDNQSIINAKIGIEEANNNDKQDLKISDDNLIPKSETKIDINLPVIDGYFYKISDTSIKKICSPNISLLETESLKCILRNNWDLNTVLQLPKDIKDHITHIVLNHNDIGGLSIIEDLMSFNSLQSLDWSYSLRIEDLGLKELHKLFSLQSLDLSNCLRITNETLYPISRLEHLRILNLNNCKNITNKGIDCLSKLINLESLDLGNCSDVTDNGLRRLSQLINLKSLNLCNLELITSNGLKYLASLSKLESLNLFYCHQLTNNGLSYIGGLTNLRELNIGACAKISDIGLKYLSSLTQLESLKISDCSQLIGDGFNYLSRLQELKALDISNCSQINDDTLLLISVFSKLETLNLDGCTYITDKGLEHLSKLKNLKSLSLQGCIRITNTGLNSISMLTNLCSLNIKFCNELNYTGLSCLLVLTKLESLELLGESQINDKILEDLSTLTNLKSLHLLSCDHVKSTGLEHIFKLVNLESITIKNSRYVSDELIKGLASLKHLKSINLTLCRRITDQGLKYLSQLIDLRELVLSQCTGISNEGLNYLTDLLNLETLNLNSCHQIDDNGIIYLSKLRELEYLYLNGISSITDKGFKRLSTLTNLKALQIKGSFSEKPVDLISTRIIYEK